MLALVLAELGLDALAMGYCPATWQRRAKGAAAKMLALGIFALIMRAGDLIVARPGFEPVAHVANLGIRFGVRVAVVLVMLRLAWDLARLAFLNHEQQQRPIQHPL